MDMRDRNECPMEASELSDEACMRAYASGDTAALRLLFDRYATRIHAMATRYLPSEVEARELVLRTFLELHHARREFREGSVVHLWVLRIAMNLLRDRWRAVSASSASLPAASPSSADAEQNARAELDHEAEFRVLERRIAEDSGSFVTRLRELTTAQRKGIVSVAFVAIAVAAIRSAHLPTSPEIGSVRVVIALLVFGMFFELALALALRPSFLPWARRTPLAVFILLTVAVSAAFASAPTTSLGTELLGPTRPHGWSSGLPCLSQGLLVAIPTYLVIRLFDRGGRVSRWLAAAASALGANLVLAVVCPITIDAHRLASHAGIGALLMVCLGMATLVERLARGSAAR